MSNYGGITILEKITINKLGNDIIILIKDCDIIQNLKFIKDENNGKIEIEYKDNKNIDLK